jgi:hypothetical protein
MSSDAIGALSMQMFSALPASGASMQGAGGSQAVDVAAFQAELERAQRQEQVQKNAQAELMANTPPAASQGLQWMVEGLSSLGGRAQGLAVEAQAKAGDADAMKPKDMLMLSVHAHEFLFHCELTSNVANRTSDGIQQLFRQQS